VSNSTLNSGLLFTDIFFYGHDMLGLIPKNTCGGCWRCDFCRPDALPYIGWPTT